MAIQFSNNATGTLVSAIASTSTSVILISGQGSLFPQPTATDFFYATLVDSSNNFEIVKVTGRSFDALTVVRAQESTSALAFPVGSKIELRPTAAGLLQLRSDANAVTNAHITNATGAHAASAVSYTSSTKLTPPIINVQAAIANLESYTFGATPIPVSGGGTGANNLTGFVIGNGTSPFTATTTVSLNPSTATPAYTSQVSGILGAANGGTGVSTLPAGAVLVGGGTGPVTSIAPGANGSALVSNGTSWVVGSAGGFAGLGATWHDVTSQRRAPNGTFNGTTYTNTRGYPIAVIAYAGNQNSGGQAYIAGTLVWRFGYDVNTGASQVGYCSAFLIVPNNVTYAINMGGGENTWWELY